MKLEHIDAKDNRAFIANVDSVDDALKVISDWCKETGFKCYYVRVAEYPDFWWFDYGSHSCFFELQKRLDKAKVL